MIRLGARIPDASIDVREFETCGFIGVSDLPSEIDRTISRISLIGIPFSLSIHVMVLPSRESAMAMCQWWLAPRANALALDGRVGSALIPGFNSLAVVWRR